MADTSLCVNWWVLDLRSHRPNVDSQSVNATRLIRSVAATTTEE